MQPFDNLNLCDAKEQHVLNRKYGLSKQTISLRRRGSTQGHKYLQDLAAQISITQIFVQNLSKYVMGSKLHRRDKNIHSYQSQSLYLSQTTPMHNWLLGPLTGVNSDFPTLALILSSSKYFRYIVQPCPSFYPHIDISDRSYETK